MSRQRTQSEIVEAAIRASGAEEIEVPADVYAGDDPEKEGEREETSAKAEERKLNEPADRLRELEEENARLREETAKYERLHKKWVLGDYSDLPPGHPFEILVHTSENDDPSEAVITPSLNGRKYPIPRGIPTRVPFAIVKILDEAKVDAVVKRSGPDGYPVAIREFRHRYPFSAHPVHGGEPMPLPIVTARKAA